MGLFAALHVAGRSLEASTTGIHVAGQNIANANTPGYIRENLKLTTGSSYKAGQAILGTGVQVSGIRQEVNKFLESRLHAASGDSSAAAAKSDAYTQLESALNELGSNDLSTGFSNFLAAVQNVANAPDDPALRHQLVGQAGELAGDVKGLRTQVDGLRQDQSIKVNDLVKEANGLIDQIDALNPQITKLEAAGLSQSDAGSLRTQRYAALQRLSEIAPTSFRERQDGGVDVSLGNDWLVLDGSKQHLETFNVADRDVSVAQVRTTKTKSDLPAGGGELGGVIAGRDEVLGSFVDDLNSLAGTLIANVNGLHASGEGQVGYAAVTASNAVADPTKTLDAAGLPSAVKHGGFDLKVVNKSTGEVTTTRIGIDLDGIGGNDTTLAGLAATLGGVANVSAAVGPTGRLSISAADGYELKFGDDTSGALAALGINTLFTGKDSGSIGVSAALVKDPRLLATGQGGGAGDNRNAAALAGALDSASGSLQGLSVTGFYEKTVSTLAQGAAAEKSLADGADAYLQSLQSQRDQYSGVSLDEEAIKVMEFQRAFQSSARIISTIDQLFGVLLNI